MDRTKATKNSHQKSPNGSKQDRLFASITKELDTERPDYYKLFGLEQPSGLEPLNEKTKTQLEQTAAKYLIIVTRSDLDAKGKQKYQELINRAGETLADATKKKEYDSKRLSKAQGHELRNEPQDAPRDDPGNEETFVQETLTLIQQEYDSSNPDYFALFRLAPSAYGRPIDEKTKAQLQETGAQYLEILGRTNVEEEQRVEWTNFIKEAGNTLAIPEKKIAYDEERVKRNSDGINQGGEEFMPDANSGSDGDEDGDSSMHDNLFIDILNLTKLYEEATPILSAYRSKVDYHDKAPSNLATERYKPLHDYNEKIMKTIGSTSSTDYIIRYTTLKGYLREVAGLESNIRTAN
ncbi:putative J domain-containing protein [Seiridium cardinale]|uniref:J domain-containing protein n=1 Tax=Seiridium cardinale TaxID=138064 RepID=A0ABR2XIH1_9PEZI